MPCVDIRMCKKVHTFNYVDFDDHGHCINNLQLLTSSPLASFVSCCFSLFSCCFLSVFEDDGFAANISKADICPFFAFEPDI